MFDINTPARSFDCIVSRWADLMKVVGPDDMCPHIIHSTVEHSARTLYQLLRG
jgi:hypothetical protein